MATDIISYLEQRRLRELAAPHFREICGQCKQPQFSCYCAKIEPFDPKIKFAILLHRLEARRRIATGRMSHLCLKNSELIVGHNFTANEQINALVGDPRYFPVVLYPGRSACNLSKMDPSGRTELFPKNKELLLFVVDGTWSTAKKMVRLSQNLVNLPQVCFLRPQESNFRVRKQPRPGCVSTIEAIHYSIELLGEGRGFDVASRGHDHLLDVFDHMVEQQLRYIRRSQASSSRPTFRRLQRLIEAERAAADTKTAI